MCFYGIADCFFHSFLNHEGWCFYIPLAICRLAESAHGNDRHNLDVFTDWNIYLSYDSQLLESSLMLLVWFSHQQLHLFRENISFERPYGSDIWRRLDCSYSKLTQILFSYLDMRSSSIRTDKIYQSLNASIDFLPCMSTLTQILRCPPRSIFDCHLTRLCFNTLMIIRLHRRNWHIWADKPMVEILTVRMNTFA